MRHMTWGTWAICLAVFGVVVWGVMYLGAGCALGGKEE